jgi:xylose isomerase
MLAVVDRIDADNRLSEAMARQDAVSAQAIVQELMFGAS